MKLGRSPGDSFGPSVPPTTGPTTAIQPDPGAFPQGVSNYNGPVAHAASVYRGVSPANPAVTGIPPVATRRN